MNKAINYLIDAKTMFRRYFKLTLRSPESLFMCLLMPALVMWMFVSLFGQTIDSSAIGGVEYVSFITPAIMILSIGQTASQATVSINVDLQKGIIDRFLSMPIAKTSFLSGQVINMMIKNIISCIIVVGVAFLLGFRSDATYVEWLLIFVISLMIMFAFTWFFIFLGILIKSTEVAGLVMVFPMILPYFSTGFTPADHLPVGLREFALYQPLTPMIETLRSLILGTEFPYHYLVLSIVWCLGICTLSVYLSIKQINKRSK